MICHLKNQFVVARPVRVHIPVVCLLFCCLISGSNGEPAPGSGGENSQRLDSAGDLKLRLRQRSVIDRYAARFHVLAEELQPSAIRPRPRFEPAPHKMKLIRSEPAERVRDYRSSLPEKVRPVRGFRAPILADRNELRPVTLAGQQLTKSESKAAAFIEEHLTGQGILRTLKGAIEILGKDWLREHEEEGFERLMTLGFPVDLLKHFRIDSVQSPGPVATVKAVAERVTLNDSTERLRKEISKIRFAFVRSRRGFHAASEDGQHPIGMVRMQIGGGIRGGLVPGGSLDVTGQVISALPEANYLVTVPNEYAEITRWLGLRCWPLRRSGQLTLVTVPMSITAWAQDNGKAGYLKQENREGFVPATLTPRFASQSEFEPEFMPGDSFLMDGLDQAGHAVIQSPLLFQGGNILVVQDPETEERVLLISETEIKRNEALGLNRGQVLEAFRIEFGVHRCEALTPVSYHLDYDVTLRKHDGEMIAFVNDPLAAAREMIGMGLDLFERKQLLTAAKAEETRAQLERREIIPAVRTIAATMKPYRDNQGRFTAPLIRHFASNEHDSPAFNFRCFLGAIDLLASSVMTGSQAPRETGMRDYFAALRGIVAASRAQHKQLEALGWRTVSVPSMPDLYNSVNYLNGLHSKTRFFMPTVGGFYQRLDDNAADVFKHAMGDEVQIIRIRTQEIQRQHGAVHCVVSAYPDLSRGEAATDLE